MSRWEQLAQLDPLFAVLTHPDKSGGQWDPDEFFETGRSEVDAVIAHLDERGARQGGKSALDFGCGPGRLTQALATHFESVVGVDVSPEMVRLAGEFNQYGDRCRYVVNDRPDLSIFPEPKFDFIFTSKVLQHIPNQQTLVFLREFLRVLRPGGLLVFQLSIYATVSSRWAWFHQRYKTLRRRLLHKQVWFYLLRSLGFRPEWLYSKLNLRPLFGMYTFDETRVATVIREDGGQILDVERAPRRHRMNATFYVRKQDA